MKANTPQTNYAHTISLLLEEKWYDIATYNTYDRASAARDYLEMHTPKEKRTGNLYIKISDMEPSVQELPDILSKILESNSGLPKKLT